MSNKQLTPRLWNDETLARQAQSALDDFVARRARAVKSVCRILGESRNALTNLLRLVSAIAIDDSNPEPELVRTIVARPDLRRTLRYVAGPPVSEDDLGVLVTRKVKRLSNRDLKQNDALSAEVLKLICRLADAGRFPWLQHRRRPRAHELKQAIRATAVLLASQTMQTERRAYGRAVERALRDRLQAIGYARVTAPNKGRITTPIHMPAADVLR
jgi:XamI restriction endonuclease